MSIPGPVSPDVLSVRGLSKAFGAVQALRDVSVDCRAGEIHALVGENGSGKSTLLGIASGFLAPDEGSVEIGGRRLARHSPAAARRLGLGIAYQDYSHVLDLSVAENIFLAVPAGARPHYGQMHGWAEETLRSFNLDLPVTAPTGSLSLAERQLLEVAKALLTRPKVLLLDESTTALGPDAVERLHALVLERARAGVAIVYVSHRLPEVLAVANRVTVLRDGVGQGTFETASVSEEALVALMIGRPLTVAFPERRVLPGDAEVVLEVSGLRGERFGPIDLVVRRGEALFPVLSVRANATIQVLRRLARAGIVPRGRERRAIAELVQRLRVRMGSMEQPVQSLSGGNQQKVSLIRPFLRGDVKVILAEEPTQGVDVGARFDIYDALRSKADDDVATVVKSSDPLELAGICDRVVVMSRGRIVEEIPRHELGERRIVEAIVGARPGAVREGATA